MKKVLLATTALALSAGIAAADVKVTGTARAGVTYTENATNELAFSSRIRIIFTASGETDGGLSFGGTIRADNAPGGNAGTAGNVFISGAFGKLAFGDVSGAAETIIGDLDGVGYTGLNDHNENDYLSNQDALARSAVTYTYSTGGLTFALSADNPGNDSIARENTYAVGVGYSVDGYSVGIGYETSKVNGVSVDHVIVGGSATFSDITLKAVYGQADAGAVDGKQYGISATYSVDALSLTAFHRQTEAKVAGVTSKDKFTGIGATYDLGGGAALAGGIVSRKFGAAPSETIADLGITLKF